jgi:membrane protease YdiL (CAAX protease family)
MSKPAIALVVLVILLAAILGLVLPLSHYEDEMRRFGKIESANINFILSDKPSVVIIAPTQETDKAVEAKIRVDLEAWRDAHFKDRPIITDIDALQRDLSSNTLIVFGTPSGNAWLARQLDQLPVRIEKNRLIVDKEYAGSNLRLITAWRNPQNPQEWVVIYTAQRAEDVIGICNVFHGPTAYVVAKGGVVLSAGNYYWQGKSWSFNRPVAGTTMQVLLPILVIIAGVVVWWLGRPHQPHSGEPDEGRFWRSAHGFAFLFIAFAWVVTGFHAIFPWADGWPWHLLLPLAGYFALVSGAPPLRRSLCWLRIGRISPATVMATAAIVVAAIAVLWVTPRSQYAKLGGSFLLGPIVHVFIMGTLFSVVNAMMEEFVFRGILFDSVGALCGAGGAIVVPALTFGIGHYVGLPSGISGACLASVFGLVLGGLRFWSGGLALPVIAHMAVDGTMVYMAVHAKVM